MAIRHSSGFFRYAFSTQYHGPSFLGFSFQGTKNEDCILPDGTDLRGFQSVEGCIRKALTRLVGCGNYENLQVSSRTDRGVHALKNTLHVDIRPRNELSLKWDPIQLRRGLNHYLTTKNQSNSDAPDHCNKKGLRRVATQSRWSRHLFMQDVSILAVTLSPLTMENKFSIENSSCTQPTTVDWNARFSATQRTYIYRIVNTSDEEQQEYGTIFEWDRSLRVHSERPLDIAAMNQAASAMLGTHDFTSFRGANCQRASPVTTMQDIRVHCQPYGESPHWEGAGGLLGLGTGKSNVHLVTIVITGDSFLYRQVRNMVGCLVAVGKRKISANAAKQILSGRDRSKSPDMVPAQGLFLVDVQHGDFVF